jgi:iron complex outermembrane receptor protein
MTRRLGPLGLILTFLLLGLAPLPLTAQLPTVTVRAEGPDGPIEGVTVTAGEAGGVTDASGEVRLGLAPGTYTLRAERLGFASVQTSVRVETGQDTVVLVRMEPQAMETEGIVVSSTRSERRIEDEPLRVEVVNREEVEEKLLMTPGDIAMLLNETAGLRVQPTAPSLGGASVRIQGLRGRYTQILSDGLPLYGGQAGALGPLQVPPMDLRQVEVIKGTASALYGPTALGGVVNLISRRPDPAREVILNASTLGGADLVGWFAGPMTGRWGYTLLAGGHYQDYADVNSDGWADVPTFKRVTLRPRLFWDDGQGSSVMFTVGGMLEDRTGGTLPGQVAPDGAEWVEALDTRRVDAGFIGQRLTSRGRILSGRASGSFQTHAREFGATLEDDQHRTTFGEVSFAGQNGRHYWVLGAAIQYDGYRHDQLPQFDFDYLVPAIFAQDEFEVTGNVTLAASARYDHHSEFGGALSPRLSLLAHTGEWTTRVSAGTGFFAPTPFTEEVQAVGLSRLNDPMGWMEERAYSGMVDLGRTFGPVEFNASAFASTIRDPIQTIRNADGTLTIENASHGSVDTWGTELFGALRTGPWRLIGSYAYLRSEEPTPGADARREVPLTPRHSVGVVGAYEKEDWGRIGVEGYYVGEQNLDDDPYRDISRPHVILGLLVDKRFGPLRVFANFENFLDTRQTRFDPLLRPEQTPDGRWITDVWAPLEGWSINGGVWISF